MLAVGLIVSMVLTLFIVPILYYKFVNPQPDEAHPHPNAEVFEPILYKPKKKNRTLRKLEVMKHKLKKRIKK